VAPVVPGIHVLPVPTPFAIGPVNTYLIEDDPLTLVDAGPNSGTALTRLETRLGELGRRVEDLERIVVTHQHLDHIGLVQILADRSGAEVVALDVLAPWLAQYKVAMDADDEFAEVVMRRHGIPADTGLALRAVSRAFRGWGAAATATETVADGDDLAFAGRTLKVLHRPGHSPTDTLFHDEAAGVLLGGDHLIGHVSSNPLVSRPPDAPFDGPQPERPQALVVYLESLARTRELELDVVLAGHGEPVTGHAELIDERFRMHARRANKIAGLIGERPRNAHEIAQALWGNVAVTQAYLTLSEVLGHVDLLLDEGRVVQHDVDGVAVFEAV
jgi:glyoxylase-like metal-dependent hydrolase (beta-lactamase superfamily II)